MHSAPSVCECDRWISTTTAMEKNILFLRLYTLEKRVGLLWWVSVFMALLSVKVKVNGYLHPHTHIYRGVMMWLSNWGYGKGFEGGINNNHVYRLAHSILFLIVIWFCLLFVRCHFVELLLLFFFECVCHVCGGSHIYCFGGHKSKHFLRSVKPNGFMIIGNWRKEGDSASQTSEFNCVL